jgi:hypothetical protein
MKFLLARFADVELLMNTPLTTAPVRHVIVVTLLSLACAFCSGCHSRAEASAAVPVDASSTAAATAIARATASAPASSTAAHPMDWQVHAPGSPLDERAITTMETVGAGEV